MADLLLKSMIRALHLVRRLAATALLGGLLCAVLVRLAPGFEVDEEQLDARRSEESRQRLRDARKVNGDVLAFYGRFLKRCAQGDLGESSLFHKPVAELLRERAIPTAFGVLTGLGVGWMAGLAMALAAVRTRWRLAAAGAVAPAALLQCLPAAVTALLLFCLGARGALASGLAVALALCPRIVYFALNILREAYQTAHVQAARARGVRARWILARHVLPACGPQLLSLAGVSVSLALSATIPMEMVLDVPGLGQLAWQAALGRDLPLLVTITFLMSLAVTAANLLADLSGARVHRDAAGAA